MISTADRFDMLVTLLPRADLYLSRQNSVEIAGRRILWRDCEDQIQGLSDQELERYVLVVSNDEERTYEIYTIRDLDSLKAMILSVGFDADGYPVNESVAGIFDLDRGAPMKHELRVHFL